MSFVEILFEPVIVAIIGVVLFVFVTIYYMDRKNKETETENRIKFLEDKLKQKNELSYGYKFKCGYCSQFKSANCQRGEQIYNSEPCETFRLMD